MILQFDPTWADNILQKFQDIVHELQGCGQLIYAADILLGVLAALLILHIIVVFIWLAKMHKALTVRQYVD